MSYSPFSPPRATALVQVALALALLGPTLKAAADPVVTPGNITVDDSGATGSGGILVAGDAVVISWDNSASGDDNPTVTTTSQVVFHFFGIVSKAADSVVGGVYSNTYVFAEGDGNFSAASAAVTVTDAQGTTGPVSSVQTVDIVTISPTVTAPNIMFDDTGASGPGNTFRPGDTVEILWDNSATGDDNPDIDAFGVEFDLSELGGPTNAQPIEEPGGIFSFAWTFQSTDPALVGARVSVTVTNFAGLTTGPVTGIDTLDFDPSPIPVPGLGPWAVPWLLLATWMVALRARPRRAFAR